MENLRLLVLLYTMSMVLIAFDFIAIMYALHNNKVRLFNTCLAIMVLLFIGMVILAPSVGGITPIQSYKIIFNK